MEFKNPFHLIFKKRHILSFTDQLTFSKEIDYLKNLIIATSHSKERSQSIVFLTHLSAKWSWPSDTKTLNHFFRYCARVINEGQNLLQKLKNIIPVYLNKTGESITMVLLYGGSFSATYNTNIVSSPIDCTFPTIDFNTGS